MTTLTSYQVEIFDDSVVVTFEGESPTYTPGHLPLLTIHFQAGAEPSSFTNRGGAIQMTRPIELLMPMLELWQMAGPLELTGSDTFRSPHVEFAQRAAKMP